MPWPHHGLLACALGSSQERDPSQGTRGDSLWPLLRYHTWKGFHMSFIWDHLGVLLIALLTNQRQITFWSAIQNIQSMRTIWKNYHLYNHKSSNIWSIKENAYLLSLLKKLFINSNNTTIEIFKYSTLVIMNNMKTSNKAAICKLLL